MIDTINLLYDSSLFAKIGLVPGGFSTEKSVNIKIGAIKLFL